ALVANVWLALSSSVYRAILLVQACFYSLALVYMLSRRVPSIGMLRIPSFFVMVNLSILDAWMRYFRGVRIVSWNPSTRYRGKRDRRTEIDCLEDAGRRVLLLRHASYPTSGASGDPDLPSGRFRESGPGRAHSVRDVCAGPVV